MTIFSLSASGRIVPRRLALQIAVFIFFLITMVSMVTTQPSMSSANQLPFPTSTQARGSTPTPTPSSQSVKQTQNNNNRISQAQLVPGQMQVDDHTVALYRFDAPNGNLAIDATGRYTGTLEGNATINPTGLYAGVLALDGQGSYVRLGNLGTLSQGTIEAYVDFYNMRDPYDPSNYSSLIFAGSEFGGNTTVMDLGADLLFDIYSNGQDYNVDSGVNPWRYLSGTDQWQNFYNWGMSVRWPYETWRFHHVAATWGPRGMEIWIDGVLHAVGVSKNPYPLEGIYDCNPQRYIAPPGNQYYNPYYPERCPTPVPAPQMTPNAPPGDYFGPLPAYDTFLIGCGTAGNCFKGRIDEVRISDVQRTFSYTIIPTVTPTPTQTPVAITGEYAVDGNTNVLFHLNSNPVIDEVSSQSKPFGGVVVSNGRFNSALESNGNGLCIVPGNLGASSSGAAEAWVKLLDGASSQPIFTAYQYYNSPNPVFYLGSFLGGPLFFSISDGTNVHWVNSGVSPSTLVGSWHHVAGTWGARGLELWIDGEIRASDPSYPYGIGTQVYTWLIGCDIQSNGMNALIDEVRVSSVQRTFTSPIYRANLPLINR